MRALGFKLAPDATRNAWCPLGRPSCYDELREDETDRTRVLRDVQRVAEQVERWNQVSGDEGKWVVRDRWCYRTHVDPTARLFRSASAALPPVPIREEWGVNIMLFKDRVNAPITVFPGSLPTCKWIGPDGRTPSTFRGVTA